MSSQSLGQALGLPQGDRKGRSYDRRIKIQVLRP